MAGAVADSRWMMVVQVLVQKKSGAYTLRTPGGGTSAGSLRMRAEASGRRVLLCSAADLQPPRPPHPPQRLLCRQADIGVRVHEQVGALIGLALLRPASPFTAVALSWKSSCHTILPVSSGTCMEPSGAIVPTKVHSAAHRTAGFLPAAARGLKGRARWRCAQWPRFPIDHRGHHR